MLLSENHLPGISRRADVARAVARLREIALDLGAFRLGLTSNLARQLPILDADGNPLEEHALGWPAEDFRWYQDPALSLKHPVTQAIRVESNPFIFQRGHFRSWYPNPLFDEIKIPNSMPKWRLRTSIVTPVHMTMGVIGVITWVTEDPDVDVDAVYDEHIDGMLALARRFITGYRYVETASPSTPAIKPVSLTQREIEFLQWSAMGKTDYEISVIHSISISTVRFHLYNASHKLGCVNRAQTIYMAAQLGYI